MIAEIQVLPTPSGTPEQAYAHVDAAIAVIQAAGLAYEVGPLGTWVEGPPDALWPLMRAVHDAALHAGARSVVTILKLAEGAEGGDALTAERLIAPHRPPADAQ